jgi:hypothetical protein
MPFINNHTDKAQRDFHMGRGAFNPRDFGVNMERVDFTDEMVTDFNEAYRDGWTIDELLLHPREAARFCDTVRFKRGYYDAPDDIILRSIMTRRKNP